MKEAKKKKGNEKVASIETGTELGLIKIHEDVIISIVSKSTISVDGVSKLAGSSLVDNIADIVGSKKLHDRSISVKLDGSIVEIEVKVNIEYGIHIPTIASKIQEVVISEVEKSTGMNVKSVDVIIQEIEMEIPEVKEEVEY